MLICKFCEKTCKNKNSHVNHERCCPKNENRNYKNNNLGKTKQAGYNCKNQWSNQNYKIKDETREKMSEASKKQVWSEERRKNHSESMKNAVKNHPESYTSSNRGRTKQIIYDGIKFQGKWELEFYIYCKNNSIEIKRCNEWFEYEWNGTRKYFPDFYLPEKDLYIEVKGYETERDLSKWKFFPKKLRVIKKDDILSIRKNSFLGL